MLLNHVNRKSKFIILSILVLSSFTCKAVAKIKNIAATPSKLIFTLDSTNNNLKLMEYPPYHGLGYDTPEPDISQGWLMGGYEWPTGGKMTFKNGKMKITYFKPSGHSFDPYIFNRSNIPADKVKHLALKLRFRKAPSPTLIGIYTFSGGKKGYGSVNVTPTGDWQIVRFNMAAISNNFWQGMRTFRIDLPEPTNNAISDEYMQTIVEIDWIALTNNSTYDGSSVGNDDYIWDFTPIPANTNELPRRIWSGNAASPIVIDRFDEQHDRLYSKFRIIDANEKPLGSMRYVTNLSEIGARDFEIPWPKSIKGLTCIFDVNDAIETGIKHAHVGIRLDSVFDRWNKKPIVTWDVDGEKVAINMNTIQDLDSKCKQMTDAGVNVIFYLTNRFRNPDFYSTNPFIHPSTDAGDRNFNGRSKYGAFNVVEERGLLYYRAAVEFLANRYTRSDKKYGLISGFVIGNEIQDHWKWYNMGEAHPLKLSKEYTLALRVADLASRRFHKDLEIYIPMDHHWSMKGTKYDRLRRIPGKTLVQYINSNGHKEGNFPWNVGFHPYPENLARPQFWNDRRPTMRLDSTIITFKNIEVLPAFLRQKKYLYEGQTRHIILAEQGFHTPPGPEGQKIQTACFAYAFHKARNIPEIKAYLYHWQVDCSGEGELRLGLWTRKEDTHLEAIPDKKKLIYEVFKKADTPEWQKAFDPYLSIIGISSWDEALPRPQKASRRKSHR